VAGWGKPRLIFVAGHEGGLHAAVDDDRLLIDNAGSYIR
jgi:hypothetical protein